MHNPSASMPAFSPRRLQVILLVLLIAEINSAFEVGMMYGILATLVREFGVARTLSYVAGTPFLIEENNVRLSAERYQRRAQEALAW